MLGGGVEVGCRSGVAPHRVFAVFEICHWSYGVGFWSRVCDLSPSKDSTVDQRAIDEPSAA